MPPSFSEKEWEEDFRRAFAHLDAAMIMFYIGKWFGRKEFAKFFRWFDTMQGTFWPNVYVIAMMSELTPKDTKDYCRKALEHWYPGQYDWEKLKEGKTTDTIGEAVKDGYEQMRLF